MKASERLRELDGRFALPSWPRGETIPNREYHTVGELWEETEEGLVALRNALPLIADVVEAAEAEARYTNRGRTDLDLKNALNALRDALERK